MKRREFIAGLGGATAAWPFAAHAQQAMPGIFLHALGRNDRPKADVAPATEFDRK